MQVLKAYKPINRLKHWLIEKVYLGLFSDKIPIMTPVWCRSNNEGELEEPAAVTLILGCPRYIGHVRRWKVEIQVQTSCKKF